MERNSGSDILFCEMFTGLGKSKNKMSYKNFEIIGLGTTRAGAALDFIDNFHREFPKKKGIYEFVIRAPLTYDIDVDKEKEQNRHFYRIKGSYTTLKKFDKDENVVRIVE